jgi:hypothetical protein
VKERVILERRDHGLQVTEPTEPPMVEVDWAAWWVTIDKRIQEHLVNERELMTEGVAETLAMLRHELREMPELRGPPGAPGKDGRFPPAKLWRDQVHYSGEVVIYDGSSYQAVNDTGKPPTFAKDWILLAVAGHDGKSLRPRGSFDADAEYKALDAVLYNGSSYVALCDDPGRCPGQKWQLVAAAGRDGATGPRGERGERGLIGPRGEPAPTITGWRVDHASYAAVPVLSNGIEGAPLELRGLFEQFLIEAGSPARA